MITVTPWYPSSRTVRLSRLPRLHRLRRLVRAIVAGASLAPVLLSLGSASVTVAAGPDEPPATAPRVVHTAFLPLETQLTHDKVEAAYNAGLPAQRGHWTNQQLYSPALGAPAEYLVWLPPGYATSGRAYPTLYLLHGVGGPSGYGVEEWLGYALTEDLDRMLGLGLIQPMIVVLPFGERSFWMNHAGGPRWGDFVAIDLVQHVDATFRTLGIRERRAVGGLSMGGHGALQLSLNYPQVFAVAGAHSPTLRPHAEAPAFFGDETWFVAHDPLALVSSTTAAARVVTWIDIGYEDRWRQGAEQLAEAYRARQAPLELRVLEGEHEGWYWKEYLPEYLRFYSAALGAASITAQGAPLVALSAAR